MKKKLAILGMALGLSAAGSMVSFAGEWKQDTTGWWYQNDDGTYPVNGWQWIDGNHDGVSECYYFGADGYMLANTTTPDNYMVNADGAWVVDGVVQTKLENTNDVENGKVTSENNEPSSNKNHPLFEPRTGVGNGSGARIRLSN